MNALRIIAAASGVLSKCLLWQYMYVQKPISPFYAYGEVSKIHVEGILNEEGYHVRGLFIFPRAKKKRAH